MPRAGIGVLIRALQIGLLVGALAGCTLDGGYNSPRAVPVLAGAVQVGVPAGYCIDSKASRADAETAVVLMGRCNDAVKSSPALITVSVGKAGSAGVMTAGGPALSAFFTSKQGRGMLSRSGRAGDVAVLSAIGVGEAILLHLNDRDVGEYWRAIVGVNGHLVTISATGTDDLALAPDESRALVDASLKATQAANPPKG